MPKGPTGQQRPRHVIGAAIRVAKIATGEVPDTSREPNPEGRRKGGMIGGAARTKALSPERRKEIAKEGARARWERKP